MKKSTSIPTFFHNVNRTFYAIQVIILMMGVPTLAFIGLSHTIRENNDNKKIESKIPAQAIEKELAVAAY